MAEAKKTKTKSSASVSGAKKSGRNQVKRNSKGQYVKGSSGNITGKNAGRPPEIMSARQQAKIMAAKNPELLDKVLNNLYEIASDKNHSQCVAAADKLVKLLGNYDPAETKDVTEPKHERVYKGLTLEQINKLLGDK